MKRIFLTSGLVLCMACPAFADQVGTTPTIADGASPECVVPTLSSATNNSTTNYTAVWSKNDYTVTYYTTTHSLNHETSKSNTATYDSAYSAPADVSTVSNPKTGYIFMGWTQNQTPSVTRDAGTGPVNTGTLANPWSIPSTWTTADDVNVYAAYLAKQYSVTYNATAHSATPSATAVSNVATYDDAYSAPTTTTLTTPATGYTFVGWSTNQTPTVERDGNLSGHVAAAQAWSAPATWTTDSNVSVYAAFIANGYDITYSCGSAPSGASKSVTAGTTNLPETGVAYYDSGSYTIANAAGTECALEGWHYNSWDCSGGNINITDQTGTQTHTWNQTVGITCTPHWVQNTINLTYTANDATDGWTPPTDATCTYDNGFDLPTAPERTGYTFSGWAIVNN